MKVILTGRQGGTLELEGTNDKLVSLKVTGADKIALSYSEINRALKMLQQSEKDQKQTL